MSEQKSVMVFIELNDGKIADVSLELVCEAGLLAGQLNTKVTAVAIGHQAEDELKKLGRYGCSRAGAP